ncbi:MAG TPA: BMP family ABC transporter substrate-binding protein, partial [Clostridiales bacterium]|nr:BMP family ABC transporter substrate-binding protein [Clostridiales bacterium]
MKNSTIKFIAILFLVSLIITGCSANTEANKPAGGKFTIGIAQLVQHPALDASRQGFIDEMEKLGVEVEFIDQNAQADINNAQMIAEKFVKDDVDLIFSIATLT